MENKMNGAGQRLLPGHSVRHLRVRERRADAGARLPGVRPPLPADGPAAGTAVRPQRPGGLEPRPPPHGHHVERRQAPLRLLRYDTPSKTHLNPVKPSKTQ